MRNTFFTIIAVAAMHCQAENPMVKNRTQKNSHVVASTADSNKIFVEKMISNRIPLKSFPEKVSKDFVIYEPSSLPFGGKYVGLGEYETLALPKILDYYDYRKFEFVGAYADGDVVFAILNVGVRNSGKHVILCEQFTFKDGKIAEIRVFVFD